MGAVSDCGTRVWVFKPAGPTDSKSHLVPIDSLNSGDVHGDHQYPDALDT